MDTKQILHDIRARPITFVPGKKVISIAPGEWTSPYEGKGYEPLGYRDFELGDDPRRINIPATARRGVPTIVERVALRDFKVMVIIDRSPSMRIREKLSIQIGVAAMLLYSAWQSETTFGLSVKTEHGVSSYGMGIGSRHFYHLYRKLWQILAEYPVDAPLKGARKMPLSRCLPPNAMLLYCSDFLKSNGELIDLPVLKRAVERYDFIPVIIQDEFEFTFPEIPHGTFISFSNPETGEHDDVWISPESADKIRVIHESRYQSLITAIGRPGFRSIHLQNSDILESGNKLDKFFRKRGGRAG